MAGNPGSPIRQAQAAANAAVPTVGSINQQYAQSIGDVNGFSRALATLLNGMPGAAAGYAPAIAQQTAIGNAAANRIAAVTGGMPMSASSGVAVGGLADSALSHLVANQAAARSMQSQLPFAAAARGALADQSLIAARNQALQQRGQQFGQAFQSALQQARQQAEVMREFGITSAQRQQQITNQNSQQQASLAEQQREFNSTNALRWATLGAQTRGTGGGSGSGALARALGLSQNELDTHVSDAIKALQGEQPTTARVPTYGMVNGTRQVTGYREVRVGGTGTPGAVQAGVPFAQAVQTLITQQGIRPQIAILAASRIYQGAKSVNPYAWETFVQWMSEHGNARYKRIWSNLNPGSSFSQPGRGSRGGRGGH